MPRSPRKTGRMTTTVPAASEPSNPTPATPACVDYGFWVWAPNADDVRLQLYDADGRDRDPADGIEMTRDDNGVWSVSAAVAYGWQYLFRIRHGADEFWRIDPRAREVTNSVGRSVIHDPAFAWTDHDFTPRPRDEWVIYELHPGTFAGTPGGTLDGAIEHLDHLVRLGVTAIELMPIGEFAGNLSWGYNPALPFAVESTYGGPSALRRFVDAAHGRGLAVVVDVVYNHLGPSDLDLWRFDGWADGDGGGIYFYNDWQAVTPWGHTRPDYGRPEVRNYLIDNARMWLADYHIDGLRLDSTINIRNVHGVDTEDGTLEAGIDFLRELTTAIHTEFPGAEMIAEDLAWSQLPTQPIEAGGLGFDSQWSAEFVHPVRAALITPDDAERDLDAVAAAVVGHGGHLDRVLYTESHDEVANGSTRVTTEVDAADPSSVFAHRRAALGAVLTMTSPGIPMLFQGQEWADENWFDDSKPLHWERAAERAGTVQMWMNLIHLRTYFDDRAPGLRGAGVSTHRAGPDGCVLVLHRWAADAPATATVVALNFSVDDLDEVDIPLPTPGEYRCVFASDWTGYHESGTDDVPPVMTGTTRLPSYGAAIFVPA